VTTSQKARTCVAVTDEQEDAQRIAIVHAHNQLLT
jgi:hypothetical protein